jgi:hypothetical protein
LERGRDTFHCILLGEEAESERVALSYLNASFGHLPAWISLHFAAAGMAGKRMLAGKEILSEET